MFNNDEINNYYKLYNEYINNEYNNKQNKKQNTLTQHGDITIDWKLNAEKVGKLMNKYRINLFKMIINELNDNNIPYFLSDGSALGCYRNGKIIPHDVDIDITVSEDRLTDAIRILKNNLYNNCTNVNINNKHEHDYYDIKSTDILIQTLDRYSKIDWNENTEKFIDLYDNYENIAKKICIKYTGHLTDMKNHENIPDLFAVAIDIYTYRKNDQYMNINYKHNDINLSAIEFPITSIFPFKSHIFENIVVFTVSNMKDYLERLYGYIGEDCYWDKKIQRFCKL